jgi:hypothetical protein
MAYVRANLMMRRPDPAAAATQEPRKEVIPPFVREQGRAHLIIQELYNFVYIPRAMPYKFRPEYSIERRAYAIRALTQRGATNPSAGLIAQYLERYEHEINYQEAAFNANHQILKRHLFRLRYTALVDCYLYKVACLYAVCTDWFCANRIDVYSLSSKLGNNDLPYAHKLGLAFPSFISTFYWNVLENEQDFGTAVHTWERLLTFYREESNKEPSYFSTKWFYYLKTLVAAGRHRDYDYANYKTIDRDEVTDFVPNTETAMDTNLQAQVLAFNVLSEIATFFNTATEEWGIYLLPAIEAQGHPICSSASLDWNPDFFRRPTLAASNSSNTDLNVLVDNYQHRLVNQALLGQHGFPMTLNHLPIQEAQIFPSLMGDPLRVFLLVTNTGVVEVPPRAQARGRAREIVIDPSLLTMGAATPTTPGTPTSLLGQRNQGASNAMAGSVSTLFSGTKRVQTNSEATTARNLNAAIAELEESESEEEEKQVTPMIIEKPKSTNKKATATAATVQPPALATLTPEMQAMLNQLVAAQVAAAQSQPASNRKKNPAKKLKAIDAKAGEPKE